MKIDIVTSFVPEKTITSVIGNLKYTKRRDDVNLIELKKFLNIFMY
jgi:hypothetical protein